VKALHRSLARDPSSLEARRFLARALIETDQLVPARAQLEQLLAAQPGDVMARIALGEVAERQGDRAAAWQSYAFVVQLAPGLEPGRIAAGHLARLVAAWPEAPPEAVTAARSAAALVPGSDAPPAP
jgi:predicted Zn-dependent protease